MSLDLRQAFTLLYGAARQARLTADEHAAVLQAAQVIDTALTPQAPTDGQNPPPPNAEEPGA